MRLVVTARFRSTTLHLPLNALVQTAADTLPPGSAANACRPRLGARLHIVELTGRQTVDPGQHGPDLQPHRRVSPPVHAQVHASAVPLRTDDGELGERILAATGLHGIANCTQRGDNPVKRRTEPSFGLLDGEQVHVLCRPVDQPMLTDRTRTGQGESGLVTSGL